MTTHAPGPYIIVPEAIEHPNGRFRFIATADWDEDAGRGHILARLTDHPQIEGNAHLFAAAPDLYEAARSAYFRLQQLEPDWARSDEMRALQAALDKATPTLRTPTPVDPAEFPFTVGMRVVLSDRGREAFPRMRHKEGVVVAVTKDGAIRVDHSGGAAKPTSAYTYDPAYWMPAPLPPEEIEARASADHESRVRNPSEIADARARGRKLGYEIPRFREEECGGVVDASGNVHSDADPGL